MRQISIASVLLLLTTLGITAQKNTSSLSFVPNKTVAIVQVNWATVRQDETLKQMVNGQDFARIVEQLGIDENRVREFTIFADATPTTANKMGVILSGGFRSQDVVRFATNKNWSSESVKSRKAFINPADGSYLLLLRDGLLVTGTRSGVERTAETFAAPATSLATKKAFNAIFTQLGGVAPIRFFMGVPQEYQKATSVGYMVMKKLIGIGSFSPLGLILTAIGLPQSVGLSISSGSPALPMHMVVQTGGSLIGPGRAALAAKGLNLLKATAITMPTADREAINGMSFSNNGAYLSIRMKIPKNQIPIP